MGWKRSLAWPDCHDRRRYRASAGIMIAAECRLTHSGRIQPLRVARRR